MELNEEIFWCSRLILWHCKKKRFFFSVHWDCIEYAISSLYRLDLDEYGRMKGQLRERQWLSMDFRMRAISHCIYVSIGRMFPFISFQQTVETWATTKNSTEKLTTTFTDIDRYKEKAQQNVFRRADQSTLLLLFINNYQFNGFIHCEQVNSTRTLFNVFFFVRSLDAYTKRTTSGRATAGDWTTGRWSNLEI